MVEILPTAVNGAAISLEIVGFILMLFSNKKMTITEGGSSLPHFTTEVVGPPNPKRYRTGITLVIIGLVGQIIAMFA